MRRPRLRLRTLLILVLLTGLGFGGYVLFRRSEEYRRWARHAEEAERFLEEQIASEDDFVATERKHQAQLERGGAPKETLRDLSDSIEFTAKAAVYDRAVREYQAKQKLKYLRAARYPWLMVEPDSAFREPYPKRVLASGVRPDTGGNTHQL